MPKIVEQHDSIHAPRLAIGEKKQPQPPKQRLGIRHGVGRSARRTGRRAAAAAGAHFGVDCDVVAVSLYRPCRAQVEAPRAAGDARSRMGAQIGGKIDEARLFELANQVSCPCNRSGDRGAITGISLHIAVA